MDDMMTDGDVQKKRKSKHEKYGTASIYGMYVSIRYSVRNHRVPHHQFGRNLLIAHELIQSVVRAYEQCNSIIALCYAPNSFKRTVSSCA